MSLENIINIKNASTSLLLKQKDGQQIINHTLNILNSKNDIDAYKHGIALNKILKNNTNVVSDNSSFYNLMSSFIPASKPLMVGLTIGFAIAEKLTKKETPTNLEGNKFTMKDVPSLFTMLSNADKMFSPKEKILFDMAKHVSNFFKQDKVLDAMTKLGFNVIKTTPSVGLLEEFLINDNKPTIGEATNIEQKNEPNPNVIPQPQPK